MSKEIKYHLSKKITLTKDEDGVYVVRQKNTHRVFEVNEFIFNFLQQFNSEKKLNEVLEYYKNSLVDSYELDELKSLISKFFEEMFKLGFIVRSSDSEHEVNRLFDDNENIHGYKILNLIAMDDEIVQVYLAEKDNQKLVLKFFAPKKEHLESNKAWKKAFQMFVQEFKLLKKVQKYPEVCQLIDFVDGEDYSYAVMEYIDGITLSKAIKDELFSLEEKLLIISDILKSVSHLHHHNILHGDIHARNFMLVGKKVKLIDLGFSFENDKNNQDQVLNKGGVMEYIPPERVNTDHGFRFSKTYATFPGEVYQMGLVIYKFFTGGIPYKGTIWKELAQSILNDELPQIANLPTMFSKVLNKSLSKNPEHRYSDVCEFYTEWKKTIKEYEEAQVVI